MRKIKFFLSIILFFILLFNLFPLSAISASFIYRDKLTFYQGDLDKKVQRVLFNVKGISKIYNAEISPVGNKIAFIGVQNGGKESIFTINLDGSKLTDVASFKGFCNFTWFSWSPNGSKIMFTVEKDEKIYLCTVDPYGHSLVETISFPIPILIMEKYLFFWSPDSKMIAFTKKGTPGQCIWFVNSEKQGILSQTQTYFICNLLCWMPDSKYLWFIAKESNKTKLYCVDPKKIYPPMDEENTNITEMIYSPDAKKMAYILLNVGQAKRTISLWVKNLNDSAKSKKIYEKGEIEMITWSPNSEKIVFEKRSSLYVINSDGSGLIQVTPKLEGSIKDLRWSFDNKKIFFHTYDYWESYFIIFADVEGNSIFRLGYYDFVGWVR